MKKYAVSLAILAALLCANAAQATDQTFPIPLYGELKTGGSFQNVGNITNDSNVTNPAMVATPNQSNTVGSFGAAVGFNFAKWGAPVRSEVEYDYRTDFGYNPNPNFTNAGVPTKSTNTLNTQTVLVNAFYDIDTGTKFTPFIGGGLGVAVNATSTTGALLSGASPTNYTASRMEFAWTLGGGVSYALDTHWIADVAYRYIDLGKVDFGSNNSTVPVLLRGDVTSNELLAGIRYQF